MKNSQKKPMFRSFEFIALTVLIGAFLVVLAGAWGFATSVRDQIATNVTSRNLDSMALVEIERIRNVADAMVANGRSFFL